MVEDERLTYSMLFCCIKYKLLGSGVYQREKQTNMKNLFLVLSFVCSLSLQAKDGKIKYGKLVIYEGGIENKQPHGQGFLKIIDPSNKGINYTEIYGQFEGKQVSKAKIVSRHFDNKIIYISNLRLISDGDKGKCTSLYVIIEDGATIASEFIGSINKKLSYVKLENAATLLHYEFVDKPITAIKQYATLKTFYGSYSPDTLSPTLTTLKYDKSMVKKAIELFEFSHGKFEGASYKYAKKDPFSYIRFLLNDGSNAMGNKIGSVVINENSWSGTRTLSNGTKVSSDSISKKLDIIYSNGDTYTGTIKEGLFYPLYANTNEPKFTYDTGTHNANGVITKWVNGETFDARHERLKSVLNDKWLAMLEEDKVSEQEAIDGQREEKEQREKDKVRKDLCAKILWDKWKCKQIMFKGDLGRSSIGDGVLVFAGVDHTCFEGVAVLTLDDNGRAVWAVLATPSSRPMNRRAYNEALNICDKYLIQTIDGVWHFEGNNLIINGVNQHEGVINKYKRNETSITLTLSNDGKTFRFDDLLGATLKIEKTLQKSVRKDD